MSHSTLKQRCPHFLFWLASFHIFFKKERQKQLEQNLSTKTTRTKFIELVSTLLNYI